jgi:hypothetical protein
VVVFYSRDHPEFDLVVESKEGTLFVFNVWDYRPHEVVEPPGSVASHQNFAGMLVEELPNGNRYRCNEGRDDDDYDDLVFRIVRTGIEEPPRQSARRLGRPQRSPSERAGALESEPRKA